MSIYARKLAEWPHMPRDYTCRCGLYVHPENPSVNPQALHCTDCDYATARELSEYERAITGTNEKARDKLITGLKAS